VQRLNVDERGELLGEFRAEDKLLIITQSGKAKAVKPNLAMHFENDLIVLEKWKANKPISVIYFDEEKGYERELKYCQNQKTGFVDEMKGDQRLEHIIFRSGSLFVPREQTVLQKLLSIYHPNKDKMFYEYKPSVLAADEIDVLEMQVDALVAARNIDIDMAEAIMRVEIGSKVSDMSSKELKRDLFLFAKHNPKLFLDLANDDNVQLRNFAIRATEANIIKLADDQRTFTWASNGRKLMTVPFDENPYSAMASFFKTDEGIQVFQSIEKKFS
jgi:hypothetical protein